MKVQPLCRGKLSWKVIVRIYKTSIVPSLLYGFDSLSIELRQLKTIDSVDASYFQ